MANEQQNQQNNSNIQNNILYDSTGDGPGSRPVDGTAKVANYLSNNHHLDPNRYANSGAPGARRRSSNNAVAVTQQLSESGARRLSAISGHGLALALEMKRKSIASYEDMPDESVSSSGQSLSKDLPVHQQMSFTMKIIYSFIMLLIHHNFGLSLSGFAPSFVDFTVMLQTNMTYIGLIPIFQAIGCMSGSLCGTLYRWLPRQIVLLTVVLFMSMGTIFMPYAKELYHLYICIFFYGFGIGAWNNSNNVWLMEMWQENSPSVLQFSQAIYGVGTIIGPMVVKPFLSGLSASELGDTTGNTTAAELAAEVSRKLKTPMMITGCIEIVGPMLLLALYFIKPYKFTSITKLENEMAVTAEDKQRLEVERRLIPKTTLIICISIFFAFGFMTENMYMDFAPTFFQFAPITLTAQRAADIASTMAIALTAGRGLCIFIVMKVRPQYMIMIHVCIIWIGVIIQYFGQENLGVLWFSAALICYGYSCIYVALFAFVNQYFEMTDAVGTIFIACYNSLYLFLPYIIGDNIEHKPDILMYLMFGCVSVAIVDFAFVMFKIRNIPKHLVRI